MRGREGENLPSITSIHGKNEERERDCEKEREGGRPSSFIHCQGLDSPPVIRLFHCAERSGWVGERGGGGEGVSGGDRGTRREARIPLLTIVASPLRCFVLIQLPQISPWRSKKKKNSIQNKMRGEKENTPPWLQMVGSVLFETTIITEQLQSSKPHLSWRLDYLCHQRAALSPDMSFTVEHNGALAHKHTHAHILARRHTHTHTLLPSLFPV